MYSFACTHSSVSCRTVHDVFFKSSFLNSTTPSQHALSPKQTPLGLPVLSWKRSVEGEFSPPFRLSMTLRLIFTSSIYIYLTFTLISRSTKGVTSDKRSSHIFRTQQEPRVQNRALHSMQVARKHQLRTGHQDVGRISRSTPFVSQTS
jgi:hypothetical protein